MNVKELKLALHGAIWWKIAKVSWTNLSHRQSQVFIGWLLLRQPLRLWSACLWQRKAGEKVCVQHVWSTKPPTLFAPCEERWQALACALKGECKLVGLSAVGTNSYRTPTCESVKAVTFSIECSRKPSAWISMENFLLNVKHGTDL